MAYLQNAFDQFLMSDLWGNSCPTSESATSTFYDILSSMWVKMATTKQKIWAFISEKFVNQLEKEGSA